MSPHPVVIAIHSPPRHQRVQLALRVAIALALGFLGISLGWIGCALASSHIRPRPFHGNRWPIEVEYAYGSTAQSPPQ